MKTSKTKSVGVAIIGTGGMANVHAQHYQSIPGCKLVGCFDIDTDRAEAFASKYEIPEAYTELDKMLAQSGCDAVSVVTPDAAHMPVSLTCLKAGKHVLCEKPLALTAPDAKKMLAAAQKASVVHMVNFSYRDWPCIQAATAAIARGEIGEIRHVEASYLQAWLPSKVWGDWRTNPAWLWRLSTKHGSRGVLGDVGVHIVDYATFPCGQVREVFCRLKTFPKVKGNRVGAYVLDANDSATLSIEFANGALGVIHTTRWAAGHTNRLALKICGSKGTISMDSEIATDSYRICSGRNLHKSLWKEVSCKPVLNNYQRFVGAIRGKPIGQPDFARGVEVQEILDACFESERLRRPRSFS